MYIQTPRASTYRIKLNTRTAENRELNEIGYSCWVREVWKPSERGNETHEEARNMEAQDTNSGSVNKRRVLFIHTSMIPGRT